MIKIEQFNRSTYHSDHLIADYKIYIFPPLSPIASPPKATVRKDPHPSSTCSCVMARPWASIPANTDIMLYSTCHIVQVLAN